MNIILNFVQDGHFWHLPGRDPDVVPVHCKNTELSSPMAWLCLGPQAEADASSAATEPAAAVWEAVTRSSRTFAGKRPAGLEETLKRVSGRPIAGSRIKEEAAPVLSSRRTASGKLSAIMMSAIREGTTLDDTTATVKMKKAGKMTSNVDVTAAAQSATALLVNDGCDVAAVVAAKSVNLDKDIKQQQQISRINIDQNGSAQPPSPADLKDLLKSFKKR